jgi:hypothetical protein
MNRKSVFAVFCAVLIASVVVIIAQAQPPYSTSNVWAWTPPAGAGSAIEAQALTPLLTLDGTTSTLVGVACSGTTTVTCTAPLLASQVTILNKWGRHSSTLALSSGGVVGASSSPFTSTVAPGAPTLTGIQ